MTRVSLLLALVTAAACGRSSSRPAAPIANAAPPPAGCEDAAAGYARARGDDHPGVDAPTLRDRVAEVCQASAWSDDARRCYADARAPIQGQPAPDDCGVHLTQAERDRLEARLAELAPPPAPSTAGLEGLAELERLQTGVPECDAYLRTMATLARCDKFPPNGRDAVIQAGAAMQDALRASPPDPNARQAMADACRQGGEALRDAATSMGCPLP